MLLQSQDGFDLRINCSFTLFFGLVGYVLLGHYWFFPLPVTWKGDFFDFFGAEFSCFCCLINSVRGKTRLFISFILLVHHLYLNHHLFHFIENRSFGPRFGDSKPLGSSKFLDGRKPVAYQRHTEVRLWQDIWINKLGIFFFNSVQKIGFFNKKVLLHFQLELLLFLRLLLFHFKTFK